MGLKLITAPPVEPLTLANAYVQCQIDTTGSPKTSPHDAWLNATIPAVRQQAENELARALVTQTWELWLHDFPRPLLDDMARDGGAFAGGYFGATGFIRRYRHQYNWNAILIPLPPLQSITSVTYIDTAGATQTLSPTAYTLDDSKTPAQITPVVNTTWPDVTCQPGAVKIRFVCGYAPVGSPKDYRVGVPAAIKHWMLLVLANWFRNREASLAQISSQTSASAPYVDALLFPYRVLDRDV